MDNIEDPAPSPKKQGSDTDAVEIPTRIDVFRSSIVPIRQKRSRKRVLLTLSIIVVLLAGLGYGVSWLFSGSKASPTKTATYTSSPKETTATSSTSTQSYTSSDFSLSLKYPTGWKVVDDGSGPMTVTSPSMQLTSATGSAVTGLITMTIQKQGQLPASFSAGTVLAVLNSQKFSYAHPTTAQLSQAYLSFVQYASTDTKGGLDGIYLTGNLGYHKDQVVPSSDLIKIDPLVTITFTKCGNASCTLNLTPLTIASTSWSNNTFQAPIRAMFASLTFN